MNKFRLKTKRLNLTNKTMLLHLTVYEYVFKQVIKHKLIVLAPVALLSAFICIFMGPIRFTHLPSSTVGLDLFLSFFYMVCSFYLCGKSLSTHEKGLSHVKVCEPFIPVKCRPIS